MYTYIYVKYIILYKHLQKVSVGKALVQREEARRRVLCLGIHVLAVGTLRLGVVHQRGVFHMKVSGEPVGWAQVREQGSTRRGAKRPIIHLG